MISYDKLTFFLLFKADKIMFHFAKTCEKVLQTVDCSLQNFCIEIN